MSGDGVVRSSAKVSAVKMVGSLAGLLAVLFLAHKYGSTAETDTYFIGRIIPVILATQLARAFSIALVPVFARIQVEGGLDESRRATGSAITFTALILVLGTLLLLFLLWPLLQIQAPGFDEAQQIGAWRISLTLVPLICLLGVGSVMEAFLNVNNIFLPSEFAANLLSVGTLIGAIILSPFLGIEGVALGTTLGASFGLILVGAYAYKRHGLQPNWNVGRGRRIFVDGFKSIVSVLCGVSAGQVVLVFVQGIATTLGEGAASLFNYAMRLVTGFPLVIGMAVGKVLMPRLVRQANLDDPEQMRHAVTAYLRGVCFVFAPYAVLFFAYREVLIRLLFPAQLFDAEELLILSATLAAYAPAIFMGSANNILIRTFHSIGHATVIIRTASIYMITGLLSMHLLCGWLDYGVAGLAMTMSVATGAQMLGLGWWLTRRIGGFVDRSVMSYLVRLGLALVVATGPVAFLLPADIFTASLLNVAISSIASAGVFMVVFLVLLIIFRVPELRHLVSGFNRAVRSKPTSPAV